MTTMHYMLAIPLVYKFSFKQPFSRFNNQSIQTFNISINNNTQMKHLLLFILSILMLSSCQKDRLTANGDQITDTRNLNEFTSLHVSGASPVHVTYGNEY